MRIPAGRVVLVIAAAIALVLAVGFVLVSVLKVWQL
jgi:hypothetical protein